MTADRLNIVAGWLSRDLSTIGLRQLAARLGRFLRLLGFRFVEDGGLHHTASLTYTTLLSLVPLMTVTLAVFSAFPVSDRVAIEIQDFVFHNFVPASGEVIREHLETFSQKASRLSGAGTVFLVIVAVMMMGNIDRAFNTIWQVRRKRSAIAVFTVYWAVLSLGPILIGISMVLTSYLVSLTFLAEAVGRTGLLGLMPVLASAVAFTLLYVLVPNRSVPLRHAIAGGVLAAVLFELAKHGFALYVTTFPTYQAIYGALAAVPVFLIWIYLSWLITLLGAEFTYCLGIYRDQWDPDRGRHGADLSLSYRLLGHLWEGQRTGASVSMESLMVHEPMHSETDLETILLHLSRARLVLMTERGDWMLARDMTSVSFQDLYWSGHFILPRPDEGGGGEPELQNLLRALKKDMDKTLDVSLAELFEQRARMTATTAPRMETAA